MTTVLLVDDHPLVLAGLVGIVRDAPDLELVATARDGEEAVEAALRFSPEVVVMDLSMPGEGGVPAIRRIREHLPRVQILVLTSATERATVLAALRAGATGYLLKDSGAEDLVRSIRSVARKESPLDPRIAHELLANDLERAAASELTGREHDVLRLLAQGLANKQIAARLGIRESTVKTHLSNAFQRIGVSDRTSAALWARSNLTTQSSA
jgi:DNA-binding NarL/FixJ family response regulator